MKLKPKAARRLMLASGIAAVVVAGVVMVVVVRGWQNDRHSARLRAEGMSAFEQGRYRPALEDLARYLRRTPEDREAWLAFAKSRERLEEPSGRHLVQAANAYFRALELDRADRETSMKLLRLYNEVGHFVEAKDLAVRLRPSELGVATTSDLDVLFAEAEARAGATAFDHEFEELTERLLSLAPESCRAAIVRVDFLIGADRKDEAVAFAGQAAKDHAASPCFAFLPHLATQRAGRQVDAAGFRATLCAAAGLDPVTGRRVAPPAYHEVAVAAELLSALDDQGWFGLSIEVLRDAAGRLEDPMCRRLLARRLWAAGLTSELLADIRPGDKQPDGESSEVLGMTALALVDADRKDDARAIVATLDAREGESGAQAWSRAIKIAIDRPAPREALDHADAAIKLHPNEPIFAYFRGNALMELGRADEAREAWGSVYASALSRGWPGPIVRVAQTLLDEGRIDEGSQAAVQAVKAAASSPAAALVMLHAQALRVEAGRHVNNPAELLLRIDAAITELGNDTNEEIRKEAQRMLLPARVALLALERHPDEAKAAVEQALAIPGLVDADLSRRLVSMSVRHKLGLESRLVDSTGAKADDLASLLDRALAMASAGRRDEANAMVDQAVKAQSADRRVEADIVRARFRDMVEHPAALETWRTLVRDHRDSLEAHIAALRAEAPTGDVAFVRDLAQRVTELGGSDPDQPSVDVRYAKARSFLKLHADQGQRDEAVSLLRTLVNEAPGRLDVRMALIDALLIDDPAHGIAPDYTGAIEHLAAAASLAPDRAPLTIRAAELMQKQGRTADALAELGRLALDENADLRGRLLATDRLAQLGDAQTALQAVDDIAEDKNADGRELTYRRAFLLATLRRDQQAVAAYRELVRTPGVEARMLGGAAAALRSLADAEGERLALEALERSDASAFDKAIARAAHAEESDPEAAVGHYAAACELAPDNAQAWVAAARFRMSLRDFAGAEAVARKGLERLPGTTELTVVVQQAAVAARPDDVAGLEALAASLEANPATVRRAAAIRAVIETQRAGTLDDAASLARIADTFADDPSTQLFVVRRLGNEDAARLAEAARIARRAFAAFPGDAEIQQTAAETLGRAGEWRQALDAANAWRATSRGLEADVLVAECHLALGEAQPALAALAANRVPAEVGEQDLLKLRLIDATVRANVLAGQAAVAKRLVQPLAEKSSVVRARIAMPAAAIVPDAAAARDWLAALATLRDAASKDEAIALAQAWSRLAARFPDQRASMLDRAVAVTSELVASPKADGQSWEAHASVLEMRGERPAALEAARKSIALDPSSGSAQVELANIILGMNGEPAQAVAAARKAVELAPGAVLARTTLLAACVAEFEAAGDDTARRNAASAEIAATIRATLAMNAGDFGALSSMAFAADTIKDRPLAISLYERLLARSQGASLRDLAAARNNLAFLLLAEHRAGGQTDALAKARALSEEAVEALAIAPTLETLGAIAAEMKDRGAAIRAYRRALSIDPTSLAATVGLAELLASGDEGERREAKQLAAAVDAAIAKGQRLSSERFAQMEQVRQMIEP
ncbi:MAG: hypothetical protein RL689_1464 [Planctomycetota bacterium]|jgi:tetratricopeptide (TPR) repeat protein